jgi:hypothetical protein
MAVNLPVMAARRRQKDRFTGAKPYQMPTAPLGVF